MMDKAQRLADMLYKEYQEEDKRGECGHLLLEWVEDAFWGRMVKDHLKVFDAVWELLRARKHTKKKPFIHGDYDYSVWVENTKVKDKKVIAATCHCACAPDNTHLYIEENCKYREPPYEIMHRFRVATVWPREKKSNLGIAWGDDRDINVPSLNTYRKRNFHYGYFDCRDEGNVLLYSGYLGGRVEHAGWSAQKIYWALWMLRLHHNELLAAIEEEKK